MADYDPKRPRRPAGSDESPAPVDALIDLAAAEQPVAPQRSATSDLGGEAAPPSTSEPVGTRPEPRPTPAVESADSRLVPAGAGGNSALRRAVPAVFVVAVTAVLVAWVLRRRRG